VGLAKATTLEKREVELPEEHRVGRPVERGARRKAPPGVHPA
jgi:hypothetical protein